MRSSSRDVAMSGILAALYVVLVYVFAPISFLQLQFRVADILYGAVPVFGIPSVLGLSIGVLIANLPSPLGIWDWLSCIPSAVGMLILYELSKINERWLQAGFFFNALVISVWVAFILWIVLGVEYFITFFYILISEVILNNILAYLLYKVLKKAFNGLGIKK